MEKKMKNNYLNPRANAVINRIKPVEGEKDEEDDEIEIVIPGSKEEKQGIEDAKLTLKAMYLSIIIIGSILGIAGIIIFKEKISFLLGLVVSILVDLFYVWHLDRGLKEALNRDAESASKMLNRDAIIRLLVIAVADISVSAIAGGKAYVAVLCGLLTLKAGIYFTPVVINIIKNKQDRNAL